MKIEDDEFYVGYMGKAPKKLGFFIRSVIGVLGTSIVAIAILVAWNQKKFSASTFEYGINSTVAGYYFEKPVPHLAVPLGKTNKGKELFQNVILVGFGKAGAKPLMDRMQQKEGKSILGAKLELTGYMIYNNGKALLQVNEEDNQNLTLLSGTMPPIELLDSTGLHSVNGEVVDPKCYFGVMKPAEGKAHRSCAIRCIAGGIPAVLHATSENDYYLLVNEKWESINDDVLTIVGDQITLTGKEIMWNDWRVLQVNTEELADIVTHNRTMKQLASFENGMTFCNNTPDH